LQSAQNGARRHQWLEARKLTLRRIFLLWLDADIADRDEHIADDQRKNHRLNHVRLTKIQRNTRDRVCDGDAVGLVKGAINCNRETNIFSRWASAEYVDDVEKKNEKKENITIS